MKTEATAIDILSRRQQADPRWIEFQNKGYALREKDGDTAVALYYKDAFITDFIQTKIDIEEVLKEATAHWREITRRATPRWCRNCVHWGYLGQWQGNCEKHLWPANKYGEDADAGDCPDYEDKAAKYQTTAAKEK